MRRYAEAMDDIIIRRAEQADLPDIASMCHRLWPDGSVAEHLQELTALLFPRTTAMLPTVVFLAERPLSRPSGFVEVGLRSHADGCDPVRAAGFVEGWYVEPASRRQGTGGRLIAAAEEWARSQGCLEMGSDTWVDNLESQHAHQAVGFEIVDRCVHFRKSL